jgi:hypothetical protein
MQDILVVDYSGPQGSVELETVESATVNRTKSRSRVKTMNRGRRAIAFQSGTEEVSVSLTVVPELGDLEVDWRVAWDLDEIFALAIEKGLEGSREQIIDCMVVSVNDTFNEAGEARQEVEIEGLRSRGED